MLARVIAEYSEYLCQKNKQMKPAHIHMSPVRDVGETYISCFYLSILHHFLLSRL